MKRKEDTRWEGDEKAGTSRLAFPPYTCHCRAEPQLVETLRGFEEGNPGASREGWKLQRSSVIARPLCTLWSVGVLNTKPMRVDCFLLSSLWLSTQTHAQHLEGVHSVIIKWVTEWHKEQKGWKIEKRYLG